MISLRLYLPSFFYHGEECTLVSLRDERYKRDITLECKCWCVLCEHIRKFLGLFFWVFQSLAVFFFRIFFTSSYEAKELSHIILYPFKSWKTISDNRETFVSFRCRTRLISKRQLYIPCITCWFITKYLKYYNILICWACTHGMDIFLGKLPVVHLPQCRKMQDYTTSAKFPPTCPIIFLCS